MMFVVNTSTIIDMLNWATQELEGGSVINPRVEAERIVSDRVGLSHAELYLHRDSMLTSSDIEAIAEAANDRITGRPLQYVLGHQQFRYLDLICRDGVLIPRPETELLVDTAISELKLFGGERKVIDVGCGTGAIGLSIAHEYDQAYVYMVDLSLKAIQLSRENTLQSGLRDRVEIKQSNLFSELGYLKNEVDIIVSNPPYICRDELPVLQREVQFEPVLALDGGADGLDFYRVISEQAPAYLKPDGVLLLEVGLGQSSQVMTMLDQTDLYSDIDSFLDYQGIERIIRARRI